MAAITKTTCRTWSFLSYFRRRRKDQSCMGHARNAQCTQKFRFYSTDENQRINHQQYCIDMTQKFDYENYMCALLYPTAARQAAFPIRAFHVEIAQIQDVVSDKQRGLMRMIFWRDTVDKIYQGTPPETPVALELAKVVSRHNLTKQWFMRSIDARADLLEKDNFRTVSDIEDYSEKSVASSLYLLLESLDIKNVHADHAASHIGRAHGIVTYLRSIPFNTSRGRVNIPLDLLLKYNVSQEDVFRGRKPERMSDIVYDIASVANQHLEIARSFKKDVPKSAVPIFLNTMICEKYLQKIQVLGFNVFDSKLQRKNGLLPLQLWLRNRTGNY